VNKSKVWRKSYNKQGFELGTFKIYKDRLISVDIDVSEQCCWYRLSSSCSSQRLRSLMSSNSKGTCHPHPRVKWVRIGTWDAGVRRPVGTERREDGGKGTQTMKTVTHAWALRSWRRDQ
jgi:hypothetical protein